MSNFFVYHEAGEIKFMQYSHTIYSNHEAGEIKFNEACNIRKQYTLTVIRNDLQIKKRIYSGFFLSDRAGNAIKSSVILGHQTKTRKRYGR